MVLRTVFFLKNGRRIVFADFCPDFAAVEARIVSLAQQLDLPALPVREQAYPLVVKGENGEIRLEYTATRKYCFDDGIDPLFLLLFIGAVIFFAGLGCYLFYQLWLLLMA
jgi:hypothetical protein